MAITPQQSLHNNIITYTPISIYSIVSIYNRFLKSSKTREISFTQLIIMKI